MMAWLASHFDYLLFLHCALLLFFALTARLLCRRHIDGLQWGWFSGWAQLQALYFLLQAMGHAWNWPDTAGHVVTLCFLGANQFLAEFVRKPFAAFQPPRRMILFHSTILALAGSGSLVSHVGFAVTSHAVSGLLALGACFILVRHPAPGRLLHRTIALGLFLYFTAQCAALPECCVPRSALGNHGIVALMAFIEILAILIIVVGANFLLLRDLRTSQVRHRSPRGRCLLIHGGTLVLFIGTFWLVTVMDDFSSSLCKTRADQSGEAIEHKLQGLAVATANLAQAGPAFGFVTEALRHPEAPGIDDQLGSLCAALKPSTCFVLDKEGTVVASSNAHEPDSFLKRNFAFRKYFQGAMAGRTHTQVARGAHSAVPGIFSATPLFLPGYDAPQGAFAVKRSLPSALALTRDESTILHLKSMTGEDILTSDAPKSMEPGHLRKTSQAGEYCTHSHRMEALGLLVTLQRKGLNAQFRMAGVTLGLLVLMAVLLGTLVYMENRLHDQEIILALNVHRQIFDKNPAMQILVEETQGLLVDANPAALQFFGRPLKEILNHPFSNLCVHPCLERTLPAGMCEIEIRSHDGEQRVVQALSWPIEIDSRRIVHSVLIDRSENRKLAEEKRSIEIQLQHASRLASVGILAAGIAHEINNPLTIVKGFQWRLRDKLRGIPGTEGLEDILGRQERGIERIASIVKQMKSLARTSQEETLVFDAHVIVRETVDFIVQLFTQSGIRMELDLRAENPELHGTPGKLQQILLNLLTNARDALHNRPEPRIRIRSDTIGAYLEIAVEDNGAGMPRAVLEQAFDPFFTTKAPNQGTGLGLAIVHKLVQDLGGTVSLESQEGLGATVRMVFELRKPQA